MLRTVHNLTGIAISAGFALAGPAYADVVTDWNAVTLLHVAHWTFGRFLRPVSRGHR